MNSFLIDITIEKITGMTLETLQKNYIKNNLACNNFCRSRQPEYNTETQIKSFLSRFVRDWENG